MPEVMLKPNWPSRQFQRTIVVPGKKGEKPKSVRTVVFLADTPVEVSPAELAALKAEIGVVLYEVARDEKNRPRYVESTTTDPAPVTE